MKSNRLRNALSFCLLAVVWGTAYPAIEIGLETLPPLLFAALRYDVATIAMAGYVLFTRRWWRPRGLRAWALVIVGGVLLIGLHFAFLFAGQQYVSSAIGAVVMSFVPVLTPAFAVVLLDDRLSPPAIGGVALGLLGVSIVAGPSPGGADGRLLGVCLLLASAVTFALGSVLTTRIDLSPPVAAMQVWMMLVGAGVLHALSGALEPTGPTQLSTLSLDAVLALGYLGVVASAGGFLLYFALLDAVGPSQVSLVNYLVPIAAALSGWLAFGEALTPTTIVGFAVICAGFALLELRPVHRLFVDHRQHRSARRHASVHTVAIAGNRYVLDVSEASETGGTRPETPAALAD